MKRLFIVCGLIPEMEWICEGVVKLRWKRWIGEMDLLWMVWHGHELGAIGDCDDEYFGRFSWH